MRVTARDQKSEIQLSQLPRGLIVYFQLIPALSLEFARRAVRTFE
jgi:hypothetical protein